MFAIKSDGNGQEDDAAMHEDGVEPESLDELEKEPAVKAAKRWYLLSGTYSHQLMIQLTPIRISSLTPICPGAGTISTSAAGETRWTHRYLLRRYNQDVINGPEPGVTCGVCHKIDPESEG